MNNLFVHLTNNAIQKTSESYNKSCDLKWPMRQLKMYMISKYGKKRVEECFYEIEMVMIRALLAVGFLTLFWLRHFLTFCSFKTIRGTIWDAFGVPANLGNKLKTLKGV